jgi:hypothetical protein
MVNRGGVGAFVASRAAIVTVLAIVGGFFLLKHDVSSVARDKSARIVSVGAESTLVRLPLSFEPNQGQSDSQVKFLARGSGYGLYLTQAEAVLAFPAAKAAAKGSSARSAVSMQFSGANRNAEVAAAQVLPGHTNYLLGNDPSRWHRNIPQFARVQYRNLYRGVNLDFYGKQGRLEYDFEVGPGADPSAIKLQFDGMRDLRIASNGDLVLALDGRELRFQAPHVYQKSASGEQNVAGRFTLRAGNQIGFEVGDYDRSRTLVIDPVLTFSTLLGGSGAESCAAIAGAQFVAHCPAIAVDSANGVYIAGATTSATGFPGGTPGTIGARGGGADVFVARISNSGSSLALDYLTFIGGGGVDYPVGIAVDSGFDVYLAGNTTSSDFPTTSSAYQTSATAGNHVFVAELDPSGSGTLYSSYLGGSGVDTASDMALDNQGRIYLIGTTTSTTVLTPFPTTQGALQGTALATNQFFFSKLNPTLSGANSLLYSTFIGGSTPSGGVVTGGGIAVDANLNVYLAGGTTFTDMPIVNAFQGTQLGGLDVWAAKLTPPANNTQQYTPLYETYFGGTGDEVAYGVAADPTSTNLYVTGSTTTAGISSPVSTVPLQGTKGSGTDAFVAKFGVPATSGTTQGSVPLTYFTYLDGGGQDVGLAIVADTNQNARVAGFTTSGTLPNPNPLFHSPGGGTDAFFARIVTTATTTTTTNTSATSILGGSGTDLGTSTAVDASLNSYIAGETASGNFPTASDPSVPAVAALQTSLSGASDAFVSKIGPNTNGLSFICTGSGCPSPLPSNPAVNPSPVGVGSSVTFTYSIYNFSDPVTGAVFTDSIGMPANSSITAATASSGTCTTSGTSALCNLGTVNSSTTTTSGTTTTTSVAATVTITVLATVPTTPTNPPTKPQSIGNSGTLTVVGTNFQATAKNSASVNDFGITVSPNTQTVSPGDQGSYVLTVTPTGIFPESVSLSCGSQLPSGATCSFSAANPIANLNNGPQSRTLDITTTARVTTPASLLHRGPIYAFWLPISGLALVGSGISRRRRWLIAIALVAVLGGITLQAGCSNTSNSSTTVGTPAGTYHVTVNATSGSATRTTAVNLIVK